jgi:non-heme chloroperoxidase
MLDGYRLKALRIEGTQLHYIDHGAGEPIIFIHGSLNDYRSWSKQFEAFAEHYHVVAYSRRYHYPNEIASSATEAPVTQQRDDLASLIQLLGLAPAYLVASSFGAYVSLLLAAQYPDLVRAIILGGPPLFPLLPPEDFHQFETEVFAPSRQALDQGNVQEGIRIFLDGIIEVGFFNRLPPDSRQHILDNASSFILEQNTPIDQHFYPFSPSDLSKVKAPTLIIIGDHSPPFLRQSSAALANLLPDVEQTVIPGASHGGLHNQNPSVYNEVLLGYLKRRFVTSSGTR